MEFMSFQNHLKVQALNDIKLKLRKVFTLNLKVSNGARQSASRNFRDESLLQCLWVSVSDGNQVG